MRASDTCIALVRRQVPTSRGSLRCVMCGYHTCLFGCSQDPTITTKRGCSALFLAAHDGLCDIMHVLLRYGADRDVVRVCVRTFVRVFTLLLWLLLTNSFAHPVTVHHLALRFVGASCACKGVLR